MRIIVNHVTRMSGDRICVAGIDPMRLQHVRPVLRGSDLTTELLKRNNGPVEVGGWIDIGARGRIQLVPPHIEDYEVFADEITAVPPEMSRPIEWFLDQVAEPSITEIFGSSLAPTGKRTYAAPAGRGLASLGVLRVKSDDLVELKVEEHVNEYGHKTERLRLVGAPSAFGVSRSRRRQDSIQVTAIDFYERDNQTVDRERVSSVNQMLHARSRGPAFVMCGLSREYQGSHWLQINGIHFAGRGSGSQGRRNVKSGPDDFGARVRVARIHLAENTVDERHFRTEFFREEPKKDKGAVTAKRKLYRAGLVNGLHVVLADEVRELAEGEEPPVRLIKIESVSGTEDLVLRGLPKRHPMRVMVHKAGICRINLSLAVRDPEKGSVLVPASLKELSREAGVDLRAALLKLGATDVKTRAELFGPDVVQPGGINALFPEDAALVPIAGYLLTRVIPLLSGG